MVRRSGTHLILFTLNNLSTSDFVLREKIIAGGILGWHDDQKVVVTGTTVSRRFLIWKVEREPTLNVQGSPAMQHSAAIDIKSAFKIIVKITSAEDALFPSFRFAV